MKKSRILRLLCIALFITKSVQISAQDWNLIWSDEFDGAISSDWVYDIGDGSDQGIPGWGNNELQYYRSENATVENGILVITAKNESFGGKNYTSARLKTQGFQSFRYGKIEARIAVPAFTGSWPAFWALGTSITELGWPRCGEIDIMEQSNESNTIHGTIHWSYFTGQGDNQWLYYTDTTAPSDVKEFHTYTVEWDPEYIRWFIDGVQYNEALIRNGINGTSEFQNDFYLLLNLAIGGQFTGSTTPQVPTNEQDAQMKVDWVRVYQKDPAFTVPVTRKYEVEDFVFTAQGVSLVDSTDPQEDASNGNWNPPLVAKTTTGNWLAYQYIDFPYTGTYTFRYRVATNQESVINTEINGGPSNGGQLLGAVTIPNTGGTSNWQTITSELQVEQGLHDLGLAITQGNIDINWFEIEMDENSLSSPNFKEGIVHLYPNPAQDKLVMQDVLRNNTYQIYNLVGQKVQEGTIDTKFLDINDLNQGVYLLKIDGFAASKFLKI